MDLPPAATSGALLGVLNADTEQRYRVLLAITDSIGSALELPGLLEHLRGLLQRVLSYDFVAVFLTDAETGVTRLLSIESRLQTRLRHDGLEFPTAGTQTERCFATQSPIVAGEIDPATHPPYNLALFREHGIESYVLVPLTTAVRRLGVLAFFSQRPNAFRDI